MSCLGSFLEAPYRPLFLLAGAWAFAAPAVWFLPEGFGLDRAAWHAHELLFGMGGAAMGGYLLTAMPAWIKRGPVSATVAAGMAILWLAARLSGLLGDYVPVAVRLIGASAYFAGLTAILAYHLLFAGVWGRFWAIIAPAVFGGAAALSVSDLAGATAMEIRNTAPLLFAVLIILIGGRAVPAFTRHWLERTGISAPIRDRPMLSRVAVIAVLGAICPGTKEYQLARGVLLILASALLFARMTAWRSVKTVRYPALFMMHVAFMWTPAGLLLLGLASIFPENLPASTTLHTLTMGAMGTMILTFMMRAAMIRRGDRLLVSRVMAGAFVLVCLSAVIRISANWLPDTAVDPVTLAAVCWMMGWALFLRAYLPALSGPVQRPVFSAALSRM
ncbi:short-chain dehydrogenase [Paramesorhizobium deserti]|uniref:Short-chain dehydrogenase n=1 Tax=Paramesorhizobium deserti TaxID=1494590 RepID=A0A135HSD1_9HYPH|nr:NnrS family protein [Paramesorhizobium deserti]KXF76098.1 short-chain dehydrogenase [Paramesorhizobium deserti]